MRNFLWMMVIALTLAMGLLVAQDKKADQKAPAQATDPVCGMTVDTKDAQKSAYKGKTYYFCSRDDKDKFDKSPDKYAKADANKK
jgi:YHS domain-containing protein